MGFNLERAFCFNTCELNYTCVQLKHVWYSLANVTHFSTCAALWQVYF